MASPSASGVKGAHRQGGDVLIDVALRIDDGRDTALHIGDEIRRVLVEDHLERGPRGRAARTRQGLGERTQGHVERQPHFSSIR